MSSTGKNRPGALSYLLAPWRWSFVSGSGHKQGCLFCAEPQRPDAESLVCWRGEHLYAMLNRYPYSSGHLMIAPYRHLAGPGDLPAAQGAELWAALQRALAVLQEAYRPEGFNVGMNVGAAAGAGIRDHFHLHVVPRWAGDANFMAIACGTRVVSYDLADVLRRLREGFAQAKPGA